MLDELELEELEELEELDDDDEDEELDLLELDEELDDELELDELDEDRLDDELELLDDDELLELFELDDELERLEELELDDTHPSALAVQGAHEELDISNSPIEKTNHSRRRPARRVINQGFHKFQAPVKMVYKTPKSSSYSMKSYSKTMNLMTSLKNF